MIQDSSSSPPAAVPVQVCNSAVPADPQITSAIRRLQNHPSFISLSMEDQSEIFVLCENHRFYVKTIVSYVKIIVSYVKIIVF